MGELLVTVSYCGKIGILSSEELRILIISLCSSSEPLALMSLKVRPIHSVVVLYYKIIGLYKSFVNHIDELIYKEL